MSNSLMSFQSLVSQFAGNPQVEEGKWFGRPCLKVNGKAFAVLFDDDMAFKLTGDGHREALQLAGAKLFDPQGSGRAFKEWVQVPGTEVASWSGLANKAQAYVGSLAGK